MEELCFLQIEGGPDR